MYGLPSKRSGVVEFGRGALDPALDRLGRVVGPRVEAQPGLRRMGMDDVDQLLEQEEVGNDGAQPGADQHAFPGPEAKPVAQHGLGGGAEVGQAQLGLIAKRIELRLVVLERGPDFGGIQSRMGGIGRIGEIDQRRLEADEKDGFWSSWLLPEERIFNKCTAGFAPTEGEDRRCRC